MIIKLVYLFAPLSRSYAYLKLMIVIHVYDCFDVDLSSLKRFDPIRLHLENSLLISKYLCLDLKEYLEISKSYKPCLSIK